MTTDFKPRQVGGTTMHLANEEQRDNFIEEISDVLSRHHVRVLEAIMLLFRTVVAGAVLILSSRIIATPPPLGFDGFALILPAPAWSTFLLSTAALSIWGRITDNMCIRRNGSVGGFCVMTALIGPLSLKAPGMCWMLFFLLVLQAVPAVHLHRACKQSDPRNLGGGS